MCALNAIVFWGGGYRRQYPSSRCYVVPGIFWLLPKMCFFFSVRLGKGDGAALPL